MKGLDLCCKAGGCSMGYSQAGLQMVGVDIEPQPNYPFEFIQADALEILQDTKFLKQFDFIHASPPCQAYSIASARWRNQGKEYPDLLDPIRNLLLKSGKPFVIENVQNAPLLYPVYLEGPMFGLRVIRRRLFESNLMIPQPARVKPAGTVSGGQYVTVAGHGGDGCGRKEVWEKAMGITWMTKKELTQAIPPAYTEYIGKHLLWQIPFL
ncbi:DNA cytosine methyltransferase [Methanosarcina sp. T3]|uniref:DNA cytosine methyltransferase n=1 Tax=Methanosarcina sp. T3 TaxID=3439062 RepID=UPI003F82A113